MCSLLFASGGAYRYPFVMASIERMRVTFTGAPFVGPSVATHYFKSGTADPAVIFQFWTNVKGLIATGGTVTVPNTGDVINDASGQVTGTWSGSGGGTIATTAAAAYALGVGGRIVWETAGLTNGRHVRGATFVVPMSSGQFDSSGRVSSAAQGVLLTSATTLVAGATGNLVVFTRPRVGVTGKSSEVIGARVSEQPTWLRSRRV